MPADDVDEAVEAALAAAGVQPGQSTINNAELRKLRKQASENAELRNQLASEQRLRVFAEVGIPVSDPAAKYFVRGYEGELTPEAIKAAAIEARVLAPSAPVSPAEVAAHNAAIAAGAGAGTPSTAPDFQAQLNELRKKQFAPTDERGRAAHIQEIARLAKEADARFPVNI